MVSGVPVVEVGGSHVTAAMVSADWRVDPVHRMKLDSQTSAGKILAQLAQAADQLPLASGLVVALPGPFDYETGVAWYRGNKKFEALYGHDVGKSLRELLKLDRILFVNDAEAFAVGEWTTGTLQGLERCVGVTIGTGIGTAFLLDGKVVRTGDTVPPGGELYRTTYRDRPVEDWISSRAILEAYSESTAGIRQAGGSEAGGSEAGGTEAGGTEAGGSGVGSGTADGREVGGAGGREVGGQVIGVKEVAELARGGSAEAKRALVDAFAALADALAPWLERFGATRVVLGGSISGAFDVVQEVFDFDVTVTADTEHSALIGAAALFLTKN